MSTICSRASSHLIVDGQENTVLHYSKFKISFYKIISSICTCAFLSILIIFALLHNIYHYFFAYSHKPEKSHLYSQQELRLKPDLSYYFRLYGLEIHKYDVITKDGYVITVQRIVDPYESNQQRNERKPMLLLHGLLQSSGSFCSGGKDSLAYYFHKQGYDIWLGNNRCGFEPRHTHLKANDSKFWTWDINDMARYDLTAMIDHVLLNSNSHTGNLTLMAHSQGTAQGFLALDNDKFGYNHKINCLIALSPAVYSGSLLDHKIFIKLISKMTNFNFFFGLNEFMPIMMIMRNHMVKWKIFGFLSYTMFNYLFDWNDKLWDPKLRNRHFLFSPVYISVNVIKWWLNEKTGFKKFKCILEHEAKWFNESSPKVFLVIPKLDKLVNGDLLIEHLKHFEDENLYEYIYLPEYSHLDVLWSQCVIEDVGEPILRYLQQNGL